ncbi:ester cyclase [Candidatus Leptofilum sp.]|uniref:ester cyclase n=1 Tax=Candidatus Leptofilum sp. TaxID=3241576 RepID=UPI003B59ADFB
MSRTNLETARLMSEEVWGKCNIELVDELYAENYVDLNPVPGIPANREGLKMQLSMFRQAFPDMQATIEDLVESGDKVVTRYSVQGTHKGDLMGIPPTGKTAAFSGITIVRFEDGKAVEEYSITDMMTMFQQLGLTPAMA